MPRCCLEAAVSPRQAWASSLRTYVNGHTPQIRTRLTNSISSHCYSITERHHTTLFSVALRTYWATSAFGRRSRNCRNTFVCSATLMELLGFWRTVDSSALVRTEPVNLSNCIIGNTQTVNLTAAFQVTIGNPHIAAFLDLEDRTLLRSHEFFRLT